VGPARSGLRHGTHAVDELASWAGHEGWSGPGTGQSRAGPRGKAG
jgi:hypothetical protein